MQTRDQTDIKQTVIDVLFSFRIDRGSGDSGKVRIFMVESVWRKFLVFVEEIEMSENNEYVE